jgi:DNA gyrase subunit A
MRLSEARRPRAQEDRGRAHRSAGAHQEAEGHPLLGEEDPRGGEDELKELAEKYGDDRRTKIVKGGVKNISVEDLVPTKSPCSCSPQGGYVKRTNPSEYKAQKRGGVGVVDIATKEEDVVTHFLVASRALDLLFFTDYGKAYQTQDVRHPGRASARPRASHHELPPARGR